MIFNSRSFPSWCWYLFSIPPKFSTRPFLISGPGAGPDSRHTQWFQKCLRSHQYFPLKGGHRSQAINRALPKQVRACDKGGTWGPRRLGLSYMTRMPFSRYPYQAASIDCHQSQVTPYPYRVPATQPPKVYPSPVVEHYMVNMGKGIEWADVVQCPSTLWNLGANNLGKGMISCLYSSAMRK